MENRDAGQREAEQDEIDWNTEHRGILHARKAIANSSFGRQSAIRCWLSAIDRYAGFVFTGLIEEVGRVVAARATDHGTQLQIAAQRTAEQARIGESIAVNGCCLTLTSRHGGRLSFDLLEETIARTNFKKLRRNSPVNLERALCADGRLGGHFVQGHIDCVAPIIAFDTKGADFRLEVELPENSRRYVASKGSIALNGISLTVAEVLPRSFAAWIIPYTKGHTNLDRATTGDLVNLEFDVLAKYVERMVAPSPTKK
jgi:riboflavin synthase